MLKLTDFYQTISGGKEDFPELDYYFSSLSPERGVDKLMIFPIECPESVSWKDIIRAEICLERELSYPNIAFRIRGQQGTDLAWYEDKSSFEQWIKRHALSVNRLEQRLLVRGCIEELSEAGLSWSLPRQAYRILREQKFDWFSQFWEQVGPAQIPLKILCQDSPEPKVNKRAQTVKAVGTRARATHVAPPPSEPAPKNKSQSASTAKNTPSEYIWGSKLRKPYPLIDLGEIDRETDVGCCRGRVEELESKPLKSGKHLLKFILSSGHNALRCVMWMSEEDAEKVRSELKNAYVELNAEIEYNDRFEQDFQAKVRNISKIEEPAKTRVDKSKAKRVELHIHSKMSAKDACSNPADIVRMAASFGHPAVALTDHGVVQGFPEAAAEARNITDNGQPINLLLGMEGYLVEDGPTVFIAPDSKSEEQCDKLAALSLIYADQEAQEVKGVAAIKTDLQGDGADYLYLEFPETFPRWPKSGEDDAEYEQREGDTNTNLAELRKQVKQFTNFLANTALISREGLSALNFIRRLGFMGPDNIAHIKFNPAYLDLALLIKQGELLELEPETIPEDLAEIKAESLSTKARVFTEGSEANRRYLHQQVELFLCYTAVSESQSWAELNKAYGHLDDGRLRKQKARRYHIVILAKNEIGLYHLYRLVSLSHLEYFYFKPRIPRSKLRYFREGLCLGTACVAGELFSMVLQTYQAANSDYDRAKELLSGHETEKIVKFYDYLEIQPLDNNYFLTQKPGSGIRSYEDLKNLNRLVLDLGNTYQRPICATCDAHFINPEDDIFRQIIMSDMGFDDEIPAPLYFRTTEEMLEEFSYLGEEIAKQIVIDNPQMIAEQFKFNLRPFPAGSFPPKIDSAEAELREMAYARALEIYGKHGKLPEDIAERLEQELEAVISNGYAVMYVIAHRMVIKSNEEGYSVGSRGSVGSSVLATFCGISEVNPLPPHYICPQCHYYEPDTSGKYGSGFDLPAKTCPDCGAELKRDGQDIPFAVFLGFKGNKQPDIDLNFSGEYQARAHAYLEDMFGFEHTFKAGTIQSYADKQSLALVRNFCELNSLDMGLNNMRQLAKGVQGVKVSTGQHPGGIVVLPEDREIYDFTPVQYPANKKEKGIITTHFDFHSLDETILKIDALGHDDPTMIKMLCDLTGINVLDIPIPDEKVMLLFRSTEAIGIPPEESTIGSATIGLPEVGTMLARSMIEDTQPTSFYDLVQLSGLSHGTGVWKGNAQDLIKDGVCTINDVIGCRDSIMNRLIYSGMDREAAFYIMETVRKGRDLKPEQLELMKKHQVPDWYIESCKKIQYLFPKAHASAYSISTQRIAYFKVYYPEAFYSVWFTIKGGDFSREEHLLAPNLVKSRRKQLRGNLSRMDKKQEKSFYVLELVEEMQARGINFLEISLEESHAYKFQSPAEGEIRPPLNVIEGISTAIAQSITDAREEGGPFETVEELKFRSGIGQAAIEALREAGVLAHLPESAQLDFFAVMKA